MRAYGFEMRAYGFEIGGGVGDLLTASARGWGWGSALRSSIFKKKNIKMSMHRLGCR